MDNLVESILTNDLVEARKLFEERMNTIRERKLYETKRRMQAEAEGKYGHYMDKADWAAYRQKHPSFGTHDVPSKSGKPKKQKPSEHEKTASGGLTRTGIEARRIKGYLPAYPATKGLEFIKAVTKYHKTGKIDEETEFERKLKAAAGEAKAASKEAKTKRQMPDLKAQAAEKEAEKKAPKKDTSGVSPEMTAYLRKRHREKTGVTAGALARKSFGQAFAPKKSLAGRVTALKRAGKALSQTKPVTIAAKPVKAASDAYGVWMQRKEPKSIGGHVLSAISKTLSAAGG